MPWYTAEIILKFNLRKYNSRNFPGASLQIPHNNKIHLIKSAHKYYLDMSVICKGPTFRQACLWHQFCTVITLDHHHPAHQVLRNFVKDWIWWSWANKWLSKSNVALACREKIGPPILVPPVQKYQNIWTPGTKYLRYLDPLKYFIPPYKIYLNAISTHV